MWPSLPFWQIPVKNLKSSVDFSTLEKYVRENSRMWSLQLARVLLNIKLGNYNKFVSVAVKYM